MPVAAWGTTAPRARLGVEVAMLAFSTAVERWMEPGNDEPFPLHAAAALSDLQARAAELDSRSPVPRFLAAAYAGAQGVATTQLVSSAHEVAVSHGLVPGGPSLAR